MFASMSASKNSWTTRGKPSSSGRMTSPPLQSVTASNSLKGRPRQYFAECRTSGGRRRPTISKPKLPQRTQKCSPVPSRKSTAAGKILARVILNRLITNISEENLPEAQCGFRPNRSTTDMIFSVLQVQEKCIVQNMDLVVVFTDLTKAFKTVNREAFWMILSKLGCPTKFVYLIRHFLADMTGPSDGEAAVSSKGLCWLLSSSTCFSPAC